MARICWDWKTRKLAWSSHTLFPFGSNIHTNSMQFFVEASAWQPDSPKDTLSIAACDMKPVSPRFALTSCAGSLSATTTISPLSRNLWPRNGWRNAERNKDDTIKRHWCNLDAMNIKLHHIASNIHMQPCLDLFFQPLPLELLQFPLLLPQEVFSCLAWLHGLIWEANHKHSISTCKKLLGNDKKTKKKQGITASLSVQFSSRTSFIYLSFAPWLLSDFSWPAQHRADWVPIRPVSKEHWTIRVETSKDLGCLHRSNKYSQRSFNSFNCMTL